MKLFSDFAFELTFMPTIQLPDHVWAREHDWEGVFSSLIDSASYELGNWKKWDPYYQNKGWREFEDDASWEITTGILTNWDKFKADYLVLLKKIKELQFTESTNVCFIAEGGCHQNYDFNRVLKENPEFDCQAFMNKLFNFVKANPVLCYIMQTPMDNESATNEEKNISSLGKGNFMTIQTTDSRREITTPAEYMDVEIIYPPCSLYPNGHKLIESKKIKDAIYARKKQYGKLELRAFMMPRNWDELELQFEWGNGLLNYIKSLVDKDLPIPKFKKKDVKSYSMLVENLQWVCGQMEFDYKRIQQTDKLDFLKQRVKKGIKYLN